MDGIFYYMAQEEAAIRQNPAKRTTELLRRVFGKIDHTGVSGGTVCRLCLIPAMEHAAM